MNIFWESRDNLRCICILLNNILKIRIQMRNLHKVRSWNHRYSSSNSPPSSSAYRISGRASAVPARREKDGDVTFTRASARGGAHGYCHILDSNIQVSSVTTGCSCGRVSGHVTKLRSRSDRHWRRCLVGGRGLFSPGKTDRSDGVIIFGMQKCLQSPSGIRRLCGIPPPQMS